MQSPFEVFRENSRVLTAVLTMLAMFAFVLLDSVTSMPSLAMPVIAMMVGALLFWAFWAQSEHVIAYICVGAVVGLAASLIGPRFWGSQPYVKTNVGTLEQNELSDLIQRQNLANQFMSSAHHAAVLEPEFEKFGEMMQQPQIAAQIEGIVLQQHPRPIPFGFSTSQTREAQEESAVLGWLMSHEADEMGIRVSDDAVSNYIREATESKLTSEEFTKIRKRMRKSEAEVFDALRAELRARIAWNQKQPRTMVLPETYWELYQRLNVSERLDVCPVPVEQFMSQAGDPSAEELSAFFEEYKALQPEEREPAAPGFVQPPRIQIAYVEADYKTVEKDVLETADVTDAEIEAEYKKRKADHEATVKPFPESPEKPKVKTGPALSNPLDPEFPPRSETPKSETPDAPADESDPKPNADPDAEKESTGPAGETSEESPEKDEAEKPKPSETPTDPEGADAAFNESRGAFGARPTVFVSFNQAEDDATDKEATNEESADKESTEPKSLQEKPVEKETSAKPDAKTADAGPSSSSFPALDDEMRDNIREYLLEQRTKQAIEKRIRNAYTKMESLANDYFSSEQDEEHRESVEEVSEKLRAYAKEHDLTYILTPLLSQQELFDSDEFAIGRATAPQAPDGPLQAMNTVTETLFQNQGGQLLVPRRAEDRDTASQFAYWKVNARESHVPTLDEEGVADQVKEAWRLFKARPLAEKRAEELADICRDSGKPMGETLSDVTLDGTEDGLQLSVSETPLFSWLETPQNLNPQQQLNQRQTPQPPNLRGIIDNPGDRFMDVVFNKLQEGEIGVAPDDGGMKFYVAKVKDRFPGNESETAGRREDFYRKLLVGPDNVDPSLQSVFSGAFQQQYFEVNSRYIEEIKQEYGVVFNRAPTERGATPN